MLILWCFGIFSDVFLEGNPAKLLSGFFLDKIYSIVCHQDASKSFFIFGNKLEVCARCTGIYTGGLICSIIALFIPRLRVLSRKWLMYCLIPMAADVFLYSIGIYGYSKWIAFTTGVILGSVSILYIFTGINDYFLEFKLKLDVK